MPIPGEKRCCLRKKKKRERKKKREEWPEPWQTERQTDALPQIANSAHGGI